MAYPDIDDVKSFLNISGSTEDTTLTLLLNAAIEVVESGTNRVFVASTETREILARPPSYSYPLLNLFMDILSISSITAPDGTLLDADIYTLEPATAPYYRVRFEENHIFYTSQQQYVSVAGDWGYSAACPAAVSLAILQYVQWQYATRLAGSTGGAQAIAGGSGVLLAASKPPQNFTDTINQYRRRRA